MKKIKILYIISYLNPGGAQYLLLDTVKRLNRALFHPAVCCLYKDYGIGPDMSREGVKLYYLKKRYLVNPFIIKDILSVIRKEKPDIVHTHLPHSTLWGRISAAIARTELIFTTEHNVTVWEKGYYFFLKHLVFFILYKLTYRWNKSIIAVSKSVKKQMVKEFGIPPQLIEINYNGIDLDHIRMTDILPDDLLHFTRPIIGTIGRLYKEKGHSILIQSFKKVKENFPEANLLIAGDGRERNHLLNLIKELGLENSVHLLGTRKDIVPLLNLMDIFAFPSLKEGLGLALIEALALEKPCVATNVGGIPEFINDGENGLLVPPYNPNALSDGIIKLLIDKRLRNKITFGVREKIKRKFDINENVKRLEKFYLKFTKEVLW